MVGLYKNCMQQKQNKYIGERLQDVKPAPDLTARTPSFFLKKKKTLQLGEIRFCVAIPSTAPLSPLNRDATTLG